MKVFKIKRTHEDKHSIWQYLVSTLTLIIIGSVLNYIYYPGKKRPAGMFLRLAKNSGKTMKTPVYKAVTVYSWDKDDVTLKMFLAHRNMNTQ